MPAKALTIEELRAMAKQEVNNPNVPKGKDRIDLSSILYIYSEFLVINSLYLYIYILLIFYRQSVNDNGAY